MKKSSLFPLLLCLILCLSACSNASSSAEHSPLTGTDAVFTQASPTNPVDLSFAQNDDAMFSGRDTRTEYDSPMLIELQGTPATCDSQNVSISGSSLTIRAEGTYLVRGQLTGALYVNAPELAKLQIVLDGVNIQNPTGAAVAILGGDKVFITLAPGSENELHGGERFTSLGAETVDGTFYSKQDVTFNGSGSLKITSPAGHAIVGNDDVVITGGSYALQAAEHGIDANDSVRLQSAALTITAGKDAIHVENNKDATRGFFYMHSGSLSATAEGDGIDASGYVQIEGGALVLTTGGGVQPREGASSDGWSSPTASSTNAASAKGIKSARTVLIRGGEINLDCADDALHANDSVFLSGGTLTIRAGDDGIHADRYLTVSGGQVDIQQSYEGLEAQDVEICGGQTLLVSLDDGINAAGGADQSGLGGDDTFGGRDKGSVLLSGGSLYIRASGDGIDANGTLTMTGGLAAISSPTTGNTVILDYDQTCVISGGTLLGVGAQETTRVPAAQGQGVLVMSAGAQAAGSRIELLVAQDQVLLSYTPDMSYQTVLISTPSLQKGATYVVSIGGESGEYEAK